MHGSIWRGYPLFWIFAVLGVLSACTPTRPPSFVSSIARAEQVEVRPGFARGETPSEDAVHLLGEVFQDRFLELTDAQRKALAQVLADDTSYTAHVDGKKCGGFHADYAVQWKSAGQPYQVLLCFGCHEALAYGDGTRRLNDLSDTGYERLAQILDGAGR